MSTSSEEEEIAKGSPLVWAGGESPAPERNPSPPREILGLSDSIGRTAFSKQWFFTTLMKLIKVIDKPKPNGNRESSAEKIDGKSCDSLNEKEPTKAADGEQGAGDTPDGCKTSTVVTADGSEQQSAESPKDKEKTEEDGVIDISDELQDELCQLWDMSSDEDVAKLLQEYKAIEMLTEVIAQSDAPRVTEIAVGILGNMACTPSVCESIAQCTDLVNISLCLLTNSDAPTLVEATRFLCTVLSNDECKEVWLKEWSSDAQHGERITFILRSSINKVLLSNTASLLDILLDISDELCNSWSSVTFLTSVIEGLKQLGLCADEGTFSLLHCLQLMSTQSNGVSAIVDQVETVADVLVEFLLNICQDEIVILEDARAAGVASVVSVLDILLTSSPAGYSLLYSSGNCIRCLLKIIYACDKEVVILGTPKNSPGLSGGNSYLITTVKDVLYQLLADTVTIMSTEETDVSQTDEKDDLSERTTPSLLKYMNNECERPRLTAVVNLILAHDGQEVIKDILELCAKYELTRLKQHILDYGDI